MRHGAESKSAATAETNRAGGSCGSFAKISANASMPARDGSLRAASRSPAAPVRRAESGRARDERHMDRSREMRAFSLTNTAMSRIARPT